jgi:hypothetical protein
VQLPLNISVEVDAERFGAYRQEDSANTDIYRLENVAHHCFSNADERPKVHLG